MAKLVCSTVLLLATMQVGCVNSPVRTVGIRSSPEPIHPTCDTSVDYIDLLGRIGNTSGSAIAIHLDDYEGPPFDPSHMAYRVYASAPGDPLQLVHNSGHDSEWDRTVSIAPGDAAMFHIPIFGLRPADYHHYFRIEFRDARNRSYWTREFELCAVTPVNCACPGPVATAGGAKAPRPACPLTAEASPGPREISLVCR